VIRKNDPGDIPLVIEIMIHHNSNITPPFSPYPLFFTTKHYDDSPPPPDFAIPLVFSTL
jgi:hypothetical protein